MKLAVHWKWMAVAALGVMLCACDGSRNDSEVARKTGRRDGSVPADEPAGASGLGSSNASATGATPSSDSSASTGAPASSAAASRALSDGATGTDLAYVSHNFVVERDGEYGYETAGGARVVMVRYLGQKRGVFTAEIRRGDAVGQMSCRAPCDEILTRYFVAGRPGKVEKTRNDGVSVGSAIFADAMAGHLRPYEAPQASR